jgi:hypothetical protein
MQFLPLRHLPRPSRPPQMLSPRPQFSSDPMTRAIEVVLRMCPDSTAQISGGGRPEWFSKEAAFRSVFLHKDERTNITVLFDGELSDEHWIRSYPVPVVPFRGGNGDSSILFQLRYILQQPWSDDTIVYVLEDDYVHRPGWTALLREGLGPITHPTLSFDYVTLYDHRDKYEWAELYRDLTSKIGVTQSIHWRTVPSTTNTFACLAWTLRTDRQLFEFFKNQDNEKFKTLTRLGRTVASCIPGWSTHAHTGCVAPCIDWDAYGRTLSLSGPTTNELVHSLPRISHESSHLQRSDPSIEAGTFAGVSEDRAKAVSDD